MVRVRQGSRGHAVRRQTLTQERETMSSVATTVATTSTRRSSLVAMMMLALATVSVTPCSAQDLPPGPTADVVYGQLGSFSTNTANNGGVSADSLNTPD